MNTAMIRTLIVSGATGLLCTTMTLPANATLPGNGYINLYYPFSSVTSGAGGRVTGTQVSIDTGIKSSQMTCFLNEVAGSLVATLSVAAPGDAFAFVAHAPADGSNWFVEYGNTASGFSNVEGSPPTVATGISCVFSTTNRIETVFLPNIGHGPGSWTIPGTGPNSQCFLSGVDTIDNSFLDPSAKVVVSRNASTGVWTLNNVNVGTLVQSNATCVDVTGAAAFAENNWTGLFTVTRFQQTSSNPEVCGLRGIAGVFTGTETTVGVFNPSSLPGNWFLSTDNGVDTGWFTCLQ